MEVGRGRRRRLEDVGGGEGADGEGWGVGDGEEGLVGASGVEAGAEERVGGLEAVEGGLKEWAGDGAGEEEAEDEDAGPARHAAAPAVLGSANTAACGGWVGHSRRDWREEEASMVDLGVSRLNAVLEYFLCEFPEK